MGDKNPKTISKQTSQRQNKAERLKRRSQEAIQAKQSPDRKK